MSEDLQRLENWVAPLLQQLEPAQRSRLARKVGMALRRSQQQRITAQRNPDGSPFAPRRNAPPRRAKAGRIKRGAMFVKIKQTRHLRARSTPNEVAVGFSGRVARIALIHRRAAPRLSARAAHGSPMQSAACWASPRQMSSWCVT